MKRKFAELSLLPACFMLAGCSGKSNENTNISAWTATVTDQNDVPIDISIIEGLIKAIVEK